MHRRPPEAAGSSLSPQTVGFYFELKLLSSLDSSILCIRFQRSSRQYEHSEDVKGLFCVFRSASVFCRQCGLVILSSLQRIISIQTLLEKLWFFSDLVSCTDALLHCVFFTLRMNPGYHSSSVLSILTLIFISDHVGPNKQVVETPNCNPSQIDQRLVQCWPAVLVFVVVVEILMIR